MNRLIEVETYNNQGTIRNTVWEKLLLDVNDKYIHLYCIDETTLPNGDKTKEHLLPFIADNSYRVPVYFLNEAGELEQSFVMTPQPDKYNAELTIFEPQPDIPLPETIGEYDMMVELFFKNRNDVKFKDAIISAIYRRKGIDTGQPYIFVRL